MSLADPLARQWCGKIVLQAYFGSVHFIWPVYSTSSFIVNKFDCVPEHEHENAKINKPHPRTKESMNLLKAKLKCKGCIGYCIPSRGGVVIILHLVLKMPTAQHYYKQELHQTMARMPSLVV